MQNTISSPSNRATEGYARPDSNHLIDVINPDTGLTVYCKESEEQVKVRYPQAYRVGIADFLQSVATKQDSPTQWEEVTEDDYHEMLNVLPPIGMRASGFMVGEPSDHHATSGKPRFSAYRKNSGKFFRSSRPMTVAEFNAIQ